MTSEEIDTMLNLLGYRYHYSYLIRAGESYLIRAGECIHKERIVYVQVSGKNTTQTKYKTYIKLLGEINHDNNHISRSN
jgi:hypothetical protein